MARCLEFGVAEINDDDSWMIKNDREPLWAGPASDQEAR